MSQDSKTNPSKYTRVQQIAMDLWFMPHENMEKDDFKFIYINHPLETIREQAKIKYKNTKRIRSTGFGPDKVEEFIQVYARKEFKKQVVDYWKNNKEATYDDLYEIFGSAYVSRDNLIDIINRKKVTRKRSGSGMSNLCKIAKTPEKYNKQFWHRKKEKNK